MERMKTHYVTILGLVLALVVVLSGQAARAELFGFEAITNNSGINFFHFYWMEPQMPQD